MRDWEPQLAAARLSARAGGRAVRAQFGKSEVTTYKGADDVLLAADVIAQDIIVEQLTEFDADYGILAEEGPRTPWPDREFVWVVDPLDGSNNFGFGIAHCAIAITLFHEDSVVLSVVWDPLLDREFFAFLPSGRCFCPSSTIVAPTSSIERTTVSLVANYSVAARDWVNHASAVFGERCRRAVNLWAPALDLALVSEGPIDAVICHDGDLRDTCGGLFLVIAAGGAVLDLDGRPLTVRG